MLIIRYNKSISGMSKKTRIFQLIRYFNRKMGAGEMVQGVKALGARPDDPGQSITIEV